MKLPDFFLKKTQSSDIVSNQITNNNSITNPSKEETDGNAWISKKTLLKMKGIGKIAFGGLVILQPHSAFLMAASVCTSWVIYSTVQAFRDPENKGTFFEKLKNAAGKQTGVMIGLLAPYVGVAIATFGGLSYLSKHAEGAQGFFQGGLMATVVGTVALPVVGWAMVGDGLINCVGYETNLLSKGFSLAKNLFIGTEKTTQAAEKSPNNPTKTLNVATVEYKDAAKDVTDITQGIYVHGKPMVTGAMDTVQQSDLRIENSKSFLKEAENSRSTIMGAIQSVTGNFTSKEDGRVESLPQTFKVDQRATELPAESKVSKIDIKEKNSAVPDNSIPKPSKSWGAIISKKIFGTKVENEIKRNENPQTQIRH